MDTSGTKEEERPPLVFISYSHDSPAHKKWVADFASRLVRNGVDVILDQWDLALGDDVPKFMEKSVNDADRVLMICTESYVRKANDGKGGVGYEAMIVTAEIDSDLGTSKFIPVIKQGGTEPLRPKSIQTRFYINLGSDETFEDQFVQLLRELHKVPSLPKPPLGKNPFALQPSGAEVPEKVSLMSSEGAGDLSLPDLYVRAIEIARAGDILEWRRLLRVAKGRMAEDLRSWRRENESKQTKTKDELIDLVAAGIGNFSKVDTGSAGRRGIWPSPIS